MGLKVYVVWIVILRLFRFSVLLVVKIVCYVNNVVENVVYFFDWEVFEILVVGWCCNGEGFFGGKFSF